VSAPLRIRITVSLVRVGEFDPEVYQRETVVAQWECKDLEARAWGSTRGSESLDGDGDLLERVKTAVTKARYVGDHLADRVGLVVPS